MSGFASSPQTTSSDPMRLAQGASFESDLLRFAVEAALAATRSTATRFVATRGFDAALDVIF
jgi:hypothetical protein